MTNAKPWQPPLPKDGHQGDSKSKVYVQLLCLFFVPAKKIAGSWATTYPRVPPSSSTPSTFAIARGPKYWGKADKFRPEGLRAAQRATSGQTLSSSHLELDAGNVQELYSRIATTTMELTLANLLYHFDWGLPDGADLNVLDMRSLCAEAPISVFCQPCIASLTMRLM